MGGNSSRIPAFWRFDDGEPHARRPPETKLKHCWAVIPKCLPHKELRALFGVRRVRNPRQQRNLPRSRRKFCVGISRSKALRRKHLRRSLHAEKRPNREKSAPRLLTRIHRYG